MANDNETVWQVALSDLPLAEQLRIIRGNYSIGSGEFDALDEAADVVECHQREIAAKDAEIARLRALIGELADALLAACNDTCDYCKKHLNFSEATASICLYNHQCNVGQAYGRLVAKAKEAVK